MASVPHGDNALAPAETPQHRVFLVCCGHADTSIVNVPTTRHCILYRTVENRVYHYVIRQQLRRDYDANLVAGAEFIRNATMFALYTRVDGQVVQLCQYDCIFMATRCPFSSIVPHSADFSEDAIVDLTVHTFDADKILLHNPSLRHFWILYFLQQFKESCSVLAIEFAFMEALNTPKRIQSRLPLRLKIDAAEWRGLCKDDIQSLQADGYITRFNIMTITETGCNYLDSLRIPDDEHYRTLLDDWARRLTPGLDDCPGQPIKTFY